MSSQRLLFALTLASLCALGGCQQQQSKQDGKVYTSTKPNSPSGGSGGSSSSSSSSQASSSKPLDSPAETINSRASQASDNGSTQASAGQVVTNPGAPDANRPKPAGQPSKSKTPGGSQ